MAEEIKVSVFCLVYNHAKYLRQCLDGFVMQKTNFRYEVLIHDDASTDESASIIHEYELKYPEIIRPYYNKENMHSQKIPIIKTFLYPMARGKYIALCEGDDFWCDENKLQTQFDIMEKHQECHICFHRVQGKNENGVDNTRTFPKKQSNIKAGELSSEDMIRNIVFPYEFQTSSYFVRRHEHEEYMMNPPEFRKKSPVGDVPLVLYMASLGKGYFYDKIMSCYRQNSIGSWNDRLNRSSRENRQNRYFKMIDLIVSYNDFTCHKFDTITNGFIKIANIKSYNLEFMEYFDSRNYLQCLSEKYKDVWSMHSWKFYLFVHFMALLQKIRQVFAGNDKATRS